MTAKEKKEWKERARASSALAVYGKAVVQSADGTRGERAVRLWDSLPKWWNQAKEDQRHEWLIAFFSRQLRLEPGDTLVSVLAGQAI